MANEKRTGYGLTLELERWEHKGDGKPAKFHRVEKMYIGSFGEGLKSEAAALDKFRALQRLLENLQQ